MENPVDRQKESNPEYAASLTIVGVSADPILCAGLRVILQGMVARLEFVVSFKEAADLILGDSPGSGSWLVLLCYNESTVLDALLYQQLQQHTPPIPVLVMGQGDNPPPPLPGLSLLWGNCTPDRLQEAITQLAQDLRPGFEQGVWWVEGARPLGASIVLPDSPATLSAESSPRGWLQDWVQRSCERGNSLVQDEIQQIQRLLAGNSQRWLDRQILQGQQRELQLVQWLLQQGLDWGDPSNSSSAGTGSVSVSDSPVPPVSFSRGLLPEGTPDASIPSSAPNPGAGGESPFSDWALDSLPPHLEDLLFDRFTAKIALPLRNVTPLPLELEALSLHKRRELLILVVQCLGDRLTELRHSGLTAEQLLQQQQEILEDLWQESIKRFFGQYTIVSLEGQSVPLVPRLLSYRESVRSFILKDIPLWPAVLQTLLFQEPVLVDGSPYRYDSPEALTRLEQLFDNLVLQVANAVVQPLLNECSKVEIIKQAYFHPRLLSTRQIERFRNDLSWKYRVLQSFEEPRNIYESRFALWVIQADGIYRIAIYAPRQGELEALTLWQQSITLSLEFRDAVAPRLQSLTHWLGQGVVYLLTQVLGKAIGLIGRGIVQGLGSVWSDRESRR